MTKLLLAIALMFAVGCKDNDSKLDGSAKTTDPVAPAPDDKGAQPGKAQRNLALDHVLSEEPEAKCVVYYQQAGQFLTDSVKCTLPNKLHVYAQVDTMNGPRVTRTTAPTEQELEAARQAQAAQAAQQATPEASAPPRPAGKAAKPTK